MTSPADQAQREQAQDLQHSCVVRAPAGSGKTELLVQRYLRALLTTEQPEQVLVLTFTNKAAGELRQRIASWVCQKPENFTGLEETQKLARAVQQKSKERDWGLQINPHRLNIATLDAYFSILYQRFCLEQEALPRTLSSDPQQLYEGLIDPALTDLLTEDPQTDQLLELFDGSMSQLRTLFLSLLLSRDRWLSSLYADESSPAPEQYLGPECQILEELTSSVAEQRHRAVAFLAQYDDTRWPSTLKESDAAYWRAWAEVLLTQKGVWRQSYRSAQGVPPQTDLHPWQQKSDRDQVLEDLVIVSETLQQAPIGAALLRLFRSCPVGYQSLPLVLSDFLKRWIARLETLKQEQRVMDFIDLNLAVAGFFHDPRTSGALEAHIDGQITHLLIDEIQDLSRLQFQIIEQILKNFSYRPEKSYFMVGDPQQAIYHFRGAHIGVFAQFEALKIPGVNQKNCLLQSNFRSAPEIVQLVNSWAKERFGAHSSSWLGVDKALESHSATNHPAQIQVFQGHTLDDEASGLLQIILRLRDKEPEASIGLLARDRKSLRGIAALLSSYHIPYDAADITFLTQYDFFIDLKALIDVVLLPEKRSVWLPMLRSSWMRASFDDIQHCYHSESETFWDIDVGKCALVFQQDYRNWQTLIQQLLPYQGRVPFTRFWDCLWENLGLRQNLQGRERQIWQTVHAYLSEHDWATPISELLENLALWVDRNPAPRTGQEQCPIKLMTVHKAKGLEFDWVLLPNLAARLPVHQKPFLIEVPIAQTLFWALNEPSQKEWFDFLDDLVKQQQDHETQRLLYVALTRARQGLVLSWNQEKHHQRSFLSSLQSLIPQAEPYPKSMLSQNLSQKTLKKVYPPPALWQWDKISWNTEPLDWSVAAESFRFDRVIGLLLHHCLSIFLKRPWPKEHLTQALLQRLWYRFGGSIEDWPQALPLIGRSLARLQQSSQLDEVFSESHQQVWSEYSLIMPRPSSPHQCQTKTIDQLIQRSDGRYWIVEWKTGASWKQQWGSYRSQLQKYAQGVQQALGGSQPQVSLYVLENDTLYTWQDPKDIPEEFLNEI